MVMPSTADEILQFIRVVAECKDVIEEGSVVGWNVEVELPEEDQRRTYDGQGTFEGIKTVKKVVGCVHRVLPRMSPCAPWIEINTGEYIVDISLYDLIGCLVEVKPAN